MTKIQRLSCLVAGVIGAFAAFPAKAEAVKVVAAENFYGDLAKQIGGHAIEVTSILSNPDQDPHLFEASPSTARAIASAAIVILNGSDYDPWMEKLIAATKRSGRTMIEAAALLHTPAGANPHLWYDPATMPAVAAALAEALTTIDPAHKDAYAAELKTFVASLEPLRAKIAAMRAKYAGQPVTASEPVFGYMAKAIGLTMRNERFQLAVMNNAEPSASDVGAFETDLKERKVKVMLFNAQASAPSVTRLLRLARGAGIPVVGITETEPAGQTYQTWMLAQLDALDHALAGR